MHFSKAAALVTLLAASPALADFERRAAEGTVLAVAQALETTVATAGATIFARVDHAEGAAEVGMQMQPSVLLIFGNPKLGTPAMLDDPLAGLVLPMKMLVYEDDQGQTWIAYEEVDDMFDGLGIDDDAEYVETMEAVMENFLNEVAGVD